MSLIDGQTEWRRYRQAMEKLGEGEKDRELKREAGLCGAERALSSARRAVNTDRQTERKLRNSHMERPDSQHGGGCSC